MPRIPSRATTLLLLTPATVALTGAAANGDIFQWMNDPTTYGHLCQYSIPNELAEEIRSADVYCYPSVAFHGEASPVAPLEAMACGLPPVVSDLPQFADYVKDGETGLVFAREGEGAVDQLTDCLRRMLTDEALRTRLRNSGIERAQAFSYPAIADAYLQDFERTLR